MKMSEARKVIHGEPEPKEGYMVQFETIEGCLLRSDSFPDKRAGEDLIPTEAEAWIWAERFAAHTKGKRVNIYVIDQDYRPVTGYEAKEIKNR